MTKKWTKLIVASHDPRAPKLQNALCISKYMFFGSRNPNLTLFFACEHCARIYTWKYMMYIKIYVFWVYKSKYNIIFCVRAPCVRAQLRASTLILWNILFISKYMFFEYRNQNMMLSFSWEHRVHVHERVHGQKYFYMHVYLNLCFLD